MTELSEHGLADFSLRRAALGAQVSCAAPYRHFKDKEEYIAEIVKYVASRWQLLADEIKKAFSHTPARLITELCMANLRFYLANPNYRSVLTLAHKSALDTSLTEAVQDYAKTNRLSDDERRLAEYTVRVIVSGTVMLVGSVDTEELLSMARKKLELEFK
jgi:AcrR family transcriptional regulator